MSLMDRIKIKDFLSYTGAEKLCFITKLRMLRTNALEEARNKKGKLTKSAKKNLRKRGKKVSDPKAAALRALASLSPKQLANIKEIFG